MNDNTSIPTEGADDDVCVLCNSSPRVVQGEVMTWLEEWHQLFEC